MMARVSVKCGNQGWIRSSIVTVASELNAEDMVLKGRKELSCARCESQNRQDSTEGKSRERLNHLAIQDRRAYCPSRAAEHV